MSLVINHPATTGFPLPAAPACEVRRVKIGGLTLAMAALVGGPITALLNATDGPSLAVLGPAGLVTALGVLLWRWSYVAVRLELWPNSIRVQPKAAGRAAEEIQLANIAGYQRARESFTQAMELQLRAGRRLKFSELTRAEAPNLSIEEWTDALAIYLDQRPVVEGVPAVVRPKIFARTAFGIVLSGLATAMLLLGGAAMLRHGKTSPPGWFFMVPSLYLSYFWRTRTASV